MTSGDLVGSAEPISRADAFRGLADRHLASSYRLARAILGDRLEAEDATHDAFLTAWRKWGSLRDPARFEPWFDRILINTCRNRLRRRGRVHVRDVSHDVSVEPRDPFRAAIERDELGHALSRLAPDQRLVVALRYYRDLTVDEIADRLRVPTGTVKSRIHYALRALQPAPDDSDPKERAR
jgi:RNA polymerase sigma-70 factor (ECF subfamily)